MDVFRWFFSCHHRRLSRVMTIHDQTFQVCLSCGEHVPYSWETMSRADRKRTSRNIMPSYAEWGPALYGDNRARRD